MNPNPAPQRAFGATFSDGTGLVVEVHFDVAWVEDEAGRDDAELDRVLVRTVDGFTLEQVPKPALQPSLQYAAVEPQYPYWLQQGPYLLP